MSTYAEGTKVTVEQSRAEIERTLVRYGASGFSYGWQTNMAVVSFDMNMRRVAFFLPLPNPNAEEITRHSVTAPWKVATKEVQRSRIAQKTREAWRALGLAIKAKLQSVDSGIASFEEEFLAHIVLPNNKTVGQMVVPQIGKAYEEKKMPPLLGYES